MRRAIWDAELAPALDDAFRRDQSVALAASDGELFINVFNPTVRLIIVGAVHVAQPLVPMARALGYDVVIVDPRSAFATEERFGDAEVARDWPDEALPKIGLDGRTALIALTHDPKIDDPALIAALASDAFYVGALGSRKTHAKRVDRLAAGGRPGRATSSAFTPRSVSISAPKAPPRSPSRSSPRSPRCNAATPATRIVSAKVAAIVLAAGRSSRMAPRNKLLERVEGTADRRPCGRCRARSGADPVIVVTGFDAPRIEEALGELKLTLVHNPDFAAGLSSSLQGRLERACRRRAMAR